MHRALRIGRHVFGRPLDRWHNVADPGKVKHQLRTGEHRIVGNQRPDIPLVKAHIWIGLMSRQIRGSAPDETVDHMHPKTLVDQKVNHVTADEPGASGDDSKGRAIHQDTWIFLRIFTL